jgi:RNA polymerase sigma factor (TIGR02999 family)
MSEVTRILEAVERGETRATEELLPLVYEELRRLAAYQLAHETPGQTLQATALVHEAYLRLIGSPDQQWNGARHFFLAAAQAMRRILIDNARRKRAACHGGGLTRVDVEQLQLAAAMLPDELLTVDDALERLAQVDHAAAELVRLRFYAGVDHGQTAEILGVSRRTADRLWAFARAWLFQELRGKSPT